MSERSRENAHYDHDYFIQVTCKRERERRDMERKYMNSDKPQWEEPELATFISEVGGNSSIQSNEARVMRYKS